jgi:hypothetical protein
VDTRGRTNFRDHVVVFARTQENKPDGDAIPTVLIKMTPSTQAEIDDLSAFFAFEETGLPKRYERVENPLDRSQGSASRCCGAAARGSARRPTAARAGLELPMDVAGR